MHLNVANCFDSIDHAVLLAALGHHVADGRIMRLVRKILAVGGHVSGWLWWKRPCGIVQGSALSPLLCNLYLHKLDEALIKFGRRPGCGLAALRYADDLLLLAATRRDARRGLAQVCALLRDLRLRLRTAHPTVFDVKSGIPWLGVRLQPRPVAFGGQMTFGYVVLQTKIDNLLCTLAEMTAPPKNRFDQRAFDLPGWLACLNEQLQAWRQAYEFADNAPDVFRVLDERAHERVENLLRSVTRSTPGQIRRDYLRWLPRGFSTWQAGGVQLVVLSARARGRRSAWSAGRRGCRRLHRRAALRSDMDRRTNILSAGENDTNPKRKQRKVSRFLAYASG